MEYKYFDKWEFKDAIDLINVDPVGAKAKFEEYFKKYPNDYSLRNYYASCFICLGEFDKAKEIIDELEKDAREDAQYQKQTKRVNTLLEKIVYSKAKILSYTEKYQELYEFCGKYSNLMKNSLDLRHLMFYARIKSGKENDFPRREEHYLYGQILEYSKESFLKHIEKHLADYNATLDNPNEVIFSPDFPLEKVLKEIEKYIGDERKTYPGFYDNQYVFKYNGCGRVKNKLVDYFCIKCFAGTGNIITMYPYGETCSLEYIDINYLREEKEDKVKVKSGMERFKERMNKRR